MKKNWKYLFLLLSASSSAQITLEHQYYIYKKDLYVSDIGNNDYKYVMLDSSGFSLYNLDHTPFLLSVVPPIPLWQPPSYYEIAYITKSLFDCDSTNIEYVVTKGNYPCNFYIFRSDGTLLFEKDSVTGPYNIGGYDGSLIQQPIVNTPNGTKLFLQDNRGLIPDSMYIYSLCGTLPASIREMPFDNNYVLLFPNPANGIINFQFNKPNDQEKFKLSIYNSLFQKVHEVTINENIYQLDIKQKFFSAGTYLFDLRTESKVYQTGKFIITK